MNKIIKSVVSIVAAVTMMCGMGAATYQEGVFSNAAIVAEAANNGVVTGCFNGYNWTGFTSVRSKNYKKSATIRVCAFNIAGWRNSARIDVQICSTTGREIKYISNFKTTANITLPKGYSTYKVRFKVHNFHDDHKCKKSNEWWANSKNFDNEGGCVYWSIDAKYNCNV